MCGGEKWSNSREINKKYALKIGKCMKKSNFQKFLSKPKNLRHLVYQTKSTLTNVSIEVSMRYIWYLVIQYFFLFIL